MEHSNNARIGQIILWVIVGLGVVLALLAGAMFLLSRSRAAPYR